MHAHTQTRANANTRTRLLVGLGLQQTVTWYSENRYRHHPYDNLSQYWQQRAIHEFFFIEITDEM